MNRYNRPAPARTVNDAAHYCEVGPLYPGDDWYVDLTPARGSGGAVAAIRRTLADVRPAVFRQILFLSHRGAGKSTELRRLESSLSSTHRTLYLETDKELHRTQLETEAVLLLLAQSIEQKMQQWHVPLAAELLQQVSSWFTEVVKETEWGKTLGTDVEAGAEAEIGFLEFAKVFAKAKALFQYESMHREQVRQVLKKFPGLLLDSVNLLLTEADKLLGQNLKRRLLVVLDNLDRYAPSVVDPVLLGDSGMFRGLKVDLILTPPIGLLYAPMTAAVMDSYQDCEIMDTVALRRRGDPRNTTQGPGLDLLRTAVSKRIELAQVFEQPSDVDDLILASGGAVRELFELVESACRRSQDPDRVTRAAVDAAMRLRLSRLRDLININGYRDVLHQVARTQQLVQDPKMSEVLFARLVLKYDGEGWYDVYPLLWQDSDLRQAFESEPPAQGGMASR